MRRGALFFLALVAACGSDDASRLAGDASTSIDASIADSATPAADVTPVDTGAPQSDVPILQVGVDAYTHWDRWPYLRLGERVYMRSTYDRAGSNHDAANFIRETASDRSTTLDVLGEGVLHFVRTNHWHGSPWHYEVDGDDVVVTDSSTADPLHPVADSVFSPAAAFPAPIAITYATARGADVSWAPIPFQSSLEIAYERTHYGTGYYIYSLYPNGAANLSRPIGTWAPTGAELAGVVSLLELSGSDLAPTGDGVTTTERDVDLPAGDAVTALDLGGSSTIRVLRLVVAKESAIALGRAHLRITWDNRTQPSVDAPIALFFGAGTLYDRDGHADLVKSFATSIHFDATTATLSTYFPMPFLQHAHVELVGEGEAVPAVHVYARAVAYTDPPSWVGLFHATYKDHGAPTSGKDLVLLDTTIDEPSESSASWCGTFVGTSFVFSDRGNLGTLEGDPRFFFDDSETPQAQGTGTEEWGGGGDYWENGLVSSLPFAGHPTGAPGGAPLLDPEDGIESAYRFLLADAFPFGKNARIQLEHGGADDSVEHYRSVAFWYGRPGACLLMSDTLHVGDAADEAAHDFTAPNASPPQTLTSRYEWGADYDVHGNQNYPATTDVGRHTTGTTEFDVAIPGDNLGLLLRRKLDYAIADQRAEVFVADVRDGAPFVHAATWYLAGSTSYVSSDPPGELDPANPQVLASQHRWRDDELMIPRALTEGRSEVRIRIVPVAPTLPLLPGGAPPAAGWSAFRYTVYAFVRPT